MRRVGSERQCELSERVLVSGLLEERAEKLYACVRLDAGGG
jgi:hypothetical protein